MIHRHRSVIFLLLIWVLFLMSCETKTNQVRIVTNLNKEWGFSIDSLGFGIDRAWFENGLPDSLKSTINIPHTWNITKGLERYFGTAWYEKNIFIPKEWADKSIRLKFGAINRNAVFYFNGEKIDEHIGAGYTSFYVDLNQKIKFGKQNQLIVKVNNEFTNQSIPYEKSFDWGNDGGIYRNVELIVTEKQAFDYVHITPTFKNDGEQISANLLINAKMLNGAQLGQNILVHATITEENQATNKIVFDEKIQLEFDSNTYSGIINLSDINLWHFDTPNLYKVEFELISNNKTTDSYSIITGFKTFEAIKDQFYLNGEKVRLPGIEWMPGSNPDKGFAEDSTEMVKMLSLIKESNAVFVRFHWQQHEFVIDWCNRNGILVQEEIPLWQKPNSLTESTKASIKTHLDEMVIRDYNAPCIFAWGIGNELDGQSESAFNLLQDAYDYLKQNLDSTRLISFTSNSLHVNPLKDATNVGDFLMWNDYQGTWQGPGTDRIGDILDEIHRLIPDKPLVISEFGLCEPQFKGGDKRRIKDLKTHVDYYLPREFVAGAIYFSLNDYRTHFGESGTGRFRQRVHGITNLTGNKKKSFTKLQNIWSPVQIDNVEPINNGIQITLSCKKTLPRYAIKSYELVGYTFVDNKKVVTAKRLIPKLLPGEKISLQIEKSEFIQIIKPNGFNSLDIEL
ncbi:MAG: glycoside hydrolase family 2 protein [Prolixibacteraceae bacterium]